MGDLDEAKEVLKLMESIGLTPDVNPYTFIISGYAEGGLMNGAQEILAEAKKKLSPVPYHALIRVYCKTEEYDQALKHLKEMDRFGVQPIADEYTKLIQSFCLIALDWEKAEMLREEMKHKGLHLDPITQGLIRAVKEMEPAANATKNEDVSAMSSLGKSFVSFEAEGQAYLAHLLYRFLLFLASVFPSLGAWYGPFLSALYNARARFWDFVSFESPGFTARKTFGQDDVAFEIARLLSLLLIVVLTVYCSTRLLTSGATKSEGELQKIQDKLMDVREAQKILQVLSIPCIAHPEELWKAQRDRLARFQL